MGAEGSKPVKKGGSKLSGSQRGKSNCMAPSEVRTPTTATQPQFAQQRSKVMGSASVRPTTMSTVTRTAPPALEPLRRPDSYASLQRTGNDGSSNAISELLPRCDSVSFANPHTQTPMLRSYREHSIILQSPNSPVHGAFPRTSLAKTSSEGIAIAGNLGSSSTLGLQNSDFAGSLSAVAHESSFGSNKSNTLHSKLMEIRGRPVGLENYGNTCYCNSVVQLLYYCTPLRLRILEMYEMYHGYQRGESLSGTASTKPKKNAPGMEQTSLLYSLCSLFATMHSANNRMNGDGTSSKNGSLTKSSLNKTGKIGPKEFLTRLKAAHIEFRNNNQQDAHEFVMLVLNSIIDTERTMLSDEKTRALIYDEKNKKGYTPMYTVGADGLEFVEGVDPSPSKKQSKHEKVHKRLSAISDLGKHTDSTSESAASGVLSTPSDQTRNSTAGAKSGTLPSDYAAGSRPNGTTAEGTKAKTLAIDNAAVDEALKTPIECIFGGEFATVTTCVECSTTTIRREDFLDLNLNIEPRTSLTRCMSHFSDTEFLGTNNKIHCQTCAAATPVTVTIRLRRMPEYALLVHLKRFRYDEKKNAFVKRADHVVLPHEIQVEEYDITGLDDSQRGSVWSPNGAGRSSGDSSAKKRNSKKSTKGDAARADGKPQAREVSGIEKRGAARFSLMGFVAHKGEGPNLGHYFSCIRYGQLWRKFDDETVTDITEREIQQFFGVPVSIDAAITSTAYIVMYERVL